MKKSFLIIFALLSCITFAQNSPAFGIKAGLNYNSNGKYINSTEDAIRNPDKNLGYHIGFFGKIGNTFYVRPELLFTQTKSDYNGDVFNIKKIDAPVLVGVTILKPVNIFAGPALQYIIDTDLEGINLTDVKNNFTIGMHIGAGIDLEKIGFDIRYERGLTKNEADFTGINTGRIDTRPDQIIFGISIKL